MTVLLTCFWDFLVGLVHNGFSVLSSTLKLDTGTGEASLSVRSSLSRVSQSHDVDVGEGDELEDDVEQGLSCLQGVLASMSEHNGSPRSISWFSSFFGFWIFGWLGQRVSPFFSSLQRVNLTQALDENLPHSDLPVL